MAIKIHRPEDDPIGYLCIRKYPYAFKEDSLSISPEIGKLCREHDEKAEAYRKELEALSKDELSVLFEDARQQDRQALALRAQREEDARSFNRRANNLDFDHYAKLRYWSIDEGVALCYGRSPEHAKWERIKPHIDISPFAKQFAQAQDIAKRAVTFKEIGELNLPGFFLAWAKRLDFPVPPALEERVEKYGVIADWKALYDKSAAQVETLMQHVEELTAASTNPPANKWPWGSYETALLRQLADAAERFWNLYDATDPTTAPTNVQVVEWLEARGVSKRNAEVMASIMRADGLPTGPRR